MYIIQRFTIDVGAEVNETGEPFEEVLSYLGTNGDIKVLDYTNPTVVYTSEQLENKPPVLANIVPAVIDTIRDLPNVIDREPDIEEVRRTLHALEAIEEGRKKAKEHIQTEIHERLVESDHKFYIHSEDENA
tara:strand:+ start:1190 stop:1585 length:396 start_codon:yes stop_codon:yes gene_type:complete